MSSEGISWLFLLSCLKWSIIPLFLASFMGFIFYMQEGEPEIGSKIWAPIIWFLTLIVLIFFVCRGIIY